MHALLNIALDDKAPGQTVELKLQNALSAVRRFFTRSIGEVRFIEYDSPFGPMAEHVAVITLEHQASKEVVLDVAAQISRTMRQDCVAVLFADGEGRLTGPRADLWAPFRLEHFKRPALYDLLAEAA